MKPKFIFFYNGNPFPINSIEELAKKIFGMKIYRSENNNWIVELNNEKRMEYASKENRPDGYTQEEVERDFLAHHFRFNYKNTSLYRLCENA